MPKQRIALSQNVSGVIDPADPIFKDFQKMSPETRLKILGSATSGRRTPSTKAQPQMSLAKARKVTGEPTLRKDELYLVPRLLQGVKLSTAREMAKAFGFD